MNKAVFNGSPDLNFYKVLTQEVNQFLSEQRLTPKGTFALYLKTFVFYTIFIYLYVHLVFFTPAVWWLYVPMCMGMGCMAAFIGFNVMHDASHGSYSKSQRVNKVVSHSLNFLGASVFFWNTKHNILHHTFTNIDGLDSDISQVGVLRLAPSQPRMKIHRFQHLYCLFLYCLAYISWIGWDDFKKYFSGKVLNTPIRDFTLEQKAIFWLTKLGHIVFYWAIPIYFVGFWPAIIGYSIMSATTGLLISIVFQLAHVVEITEFEDATQHDLTIEHEWAIHQIKTTANFATNNRIVSWFLGGLNFQVEHHLFPKISHIHYPKIQPIVKSVCERFGVEYLDYPTMSASIASHLRMMRYLGTA